MIGPGYTFTSRQLQSVPPALSGADIAFVGVSVDDRGFATVNALKDVTKTLSDFRFDQDHQEIYLNEHKTNRQRLIEHMGGCSRILIDATTLGLGEILHILMAARQGGHRAVEFLYAEPIKYTENKTANKEEPQRRDFALTRNCRFQAVLGFAHEYQSNMKAAHVFMLGYESARIGNAIEQLGERNRKLYGVYAIIGVPAFQSGWEANSIRPHLHVLEELDIDEHSIVYCQANSIRETYLTLWELYRQLGDESGCFYVSPIGTKPHAVGAALFLLETKGIEPTTSLYYDHPVRVNKRSEGNATWHHVTVRLA
jgi:hypothetical protein